MKPHSIETSYEQAERDMLISLAKPGDVFFDVGAYVGWYSLNFAVRVPRSHVYAFEPIPEILVELERNTERLGNVICSPFGLSEAHGEVYFYISEREPGTASLARLEEARFGIARSIICPVTTIDFLRPVPNLIKIDVEGAELLVLKGAVRTLAMHHPIIQCEMLRKWAKRFNYHPNDLIAFLAGFGYRCHTLKDGKLQPFATMTDETTETNFFFLPEAK